MKASAATSPAPDGHAPPAPLPGLQAEVKVRRETGRGRRWASQKRRELARRVPELRAALATNISVKELRERLRLEGIHVSRWMLTDLLGPFKPSPPDDPDPAKTDGISPAVEPSNP